MPTFGSLFSGIDGLGLGLERAGWELRWQVEIDGWCRRVLGKHWPHVRRFADIREISAEEREPVDLIAGGFPCQDISSARTRNARAGLTGSQSGLWTEFRRFIWALGPTWALIENSDQWRRWVPAARADLARMGYASLPVVLQAGSFGAPHRRPRCFVVAHADGESEPLRSLHAAVASLRPLPMGSGHWRTSPPGGFRVDDGVPDGVHRSQGLGNAVVPQVAEWIGRRLMDSWKTASPKGGQ